MAYQARKLKRFIEDFELINENGEVETTIHVELEPDDIVMKLQRKYTTLCQTLTEVQEMRRKPISNEELGSYLEKLGNAVIQLFEAVFGETDTKTIVDFYENRYIEMCHEVVPFIRTVVIPRVQELKKQNQRTLLKPYNRKKYRK